MKRGRRYNRRTNNETNYIMEQKRDRHLEQLEARLQKKWMKEQGIDMSKRKNNGNNRYFG